jgi:ribose 5-phosphate isomerase A
LREKILAQSSRRKVVIVDQDKLSPRLGTRRALPVEVVAFALRTTEVYLSAIGGRVSRRKTDTGRKFKTDQGNLILDVAFGPIQNATALAAKLADRAGIVAHGLFLGLADEVIVAGAAGVSHLRRDPQPAP